MEGDENAEFVIGVSSLVIGTRREECGVGRGPSQSNSGHSCLRRLSDALRCEQNLVAIQDSSLC